MPTWNEADHFARTILAAKSAVPDCELVVVDAGSKDGTVELARSETERVLVSAVRQRAAQMNAGAAAATGEVLMFLHADTLLPRDAGESMARAMGKPGCVGGGFVRRFDAPSFFLRSTCFLAAWRCRAFGWFLGDQAIFVRRAAFDKLRGFKSWDRFEDLDFSRRLGSLGRLATLSPPVLSSARRFQREGPWRRTWRDFALTMQYLNGNPAATMNSAKERNDAR